MTMGEGLQRARRAALRTGNGPWVVQNGDWYLSEGPSWAVSTWVQDVRHASRYQTRLAAREVAAEARKGGWRPFGRAPDATVAARVVEKESRDR
jgi:hypothetical protein